MKNQQQFETEQQRKADERDERLATSIIIALLSFTAGCLLYEFFTQLEIIKHIL